MQWQGAISSFWKTIRAIQDFIVWMRLSAGFFSRKRQGQLQVVKLSFLYERKLIRSSVLFCMLKSSEGYDSVTI
ncbi:hypothetical protein EMIT074MI3_20865 [Bacillus licheniformis]